MDDTLSDNEYFPITPDQVKLLIESSSRKSFLCEYTDAVEGVPKTPSLYVAFPRGMEHQQKLLKKKIKELEGNTVSNEPKERATTSTTKNKDPLKRSTSHSSEEKGNKAKPTTEKKERLILEELGIQEDSSDNSTPIKKKKHRSSDSSEEKTPQKLKGSKVSKKNMGSSGEKSSNSSKKPKVKSKTFQEDSEAKSTNTTKSSDGLDINTSVLHDNRISDSDEEETFDMEARHITDSLPENFEEKKSKGLALKFSLSKEARFYLCHPRNKDIRTTISNFVIKKNNLKYKITPKAFILEVDSVEQEKSLKNLKAVRDLLKKKIKNEFKFETHDLEPSDFHAYKKIFHTGDQKERFQMVSFLRYSQSDSDKMKALICAFGANEAKVKEMLSFLKDRSALKLGIVKIKYPKAIKGVKKGGMSSRHDFDILVEEGKLVSQYFKEKKDVIKREMEKEAAFQKLDCKMTLFQSSRSDREYNQSIIFHWKNMLKYSWKEESLFFDRYISKLKLEFYYKLRFCVLRFKKVDSQSYFPEIKRKDDFVWCSVNKFTGPKKEAKVNLFGDPGAIISFLEANDVKDELINTQKHSGQMALLLKFPHYDPEVEFFKFHREFPKVIEKASPYRKEATCLLVKIVFKKEKYAEIVETIKKILLKGNPKNEKKEQNSTLNKGFYLDKKSSDEERKRSKKEEKKAKKTEQKTEFHVSEDEVEDCGTQFI